ncbi:hypothetical protein LTR36_007447 [Oleoguttula mirabilis]|uniref:F-box domain-containing protein n=1 Tax=Oleoguttula mirabilis TaxID=1507867 RepID=A0AAV9J9S1_9PEZI|nr:hypothetical protein LTR36_007447 [Oleoguttula mirabilis]
MLRLPTELQINIVDYLTSKADLRSLCSACKELSSIASPRLYHTVVLSTVELSKAIPLGLSRGNAGLKYIRVLKIRLAASRIMEGRHAANLKRAYRLLLAIPKHTLNVFEFNSTGTVTRTTLDTLKTTILSTGTVSRLMVDTLHSRQSRLTNYQVHRTVGCLLHAPLPRSENVQNVTQLSFYLITEQDARRARHVLGLVSKVQVLNIRFGKWTHDEQARKKAPVAQSQLMQNMLSEQPDAGIGRLAVRSLRLDGADLDDLGKELPSMIDFQGLTSLILDSCVETATLLEWITPLKLGLQTFADLRSGNSGGHSGWLIDEFLHSLCAPQRISLSQSNYTPDDDDDIRTHFTAIREKTATLKLLHVDDHHIDTQTPFQASGPRLPEFCDLCVRCERLEQLAIYAPCWSENTEKDRNELFSGFMDCVSHLSSLVTMRLFLRPEAAQDFDRDDDRRFSDNDDYSDNRLELSFRYKMQQLADKIFQRLATPCPRFAALVLEVRGDDDDSGSLRPLQYGYLRGARTDMYGRTAAVGIPIEVHLIKHHEPCCEVLEE